MKTKDYDNDNDRIQARYRKFTRDELIRDLHSMRTEARNHESNVMVNLGIFNILLITAIIGLVTNLLTCLG